MGFGLWCLGLRVQGSGFRVQDSGFRVWGSGFGLWGSRFRVQGSGFGVWATGMFRTTPETVTLTESLSVAPADAAAFVFFARDSSALFRVLEITISVCSLGFRGVGSV